MVTEPKRNTILPEFLDTFCIRIGDLPSNGEKDFPHCKFNSTDTLKESMTYIYHEGYLNFNIDGTSYLTCDCPDVRKYLESKGYRVSESQGKGKRTTLAAWYNVSLMSLIYPVDSPIFRKFLALSYIDLNYGPYNNQLNEENYCNTIMNRNTGTIGTTDEEILRTVERMKSEEIIFNDELWSKCSWRSYEQEQKDIIIFDKAYKFLQSKVFELDYNNVSLGKRLSVEDREKVINYWLAANGIEANYTLSEPYITHVATECQEKGGYQKLYNLASSDQRDTLLSRLGTFCESPEEFESALMGLISYTPSGHAQFVKNLQSQYPTVPDAVPLSTPTTSHVSDKSIPESPDGRE